MDTLLPSRLIPAFGGFMSAVQVPEASSAQSDIDAEAELTAAAASVAASRALRAGARAPFFTLSDANGRKVTLEALLSAGPVVLHFSRGAWCTFGEESLSELSSTNQEVIALGASAVSIAPPFDSFNKPSIQPLKPDAGPAFTPIRELQDVDMKVARAYGLAFDLPVGLRPKYARLGYRPPATSKADTWLVPLPATYLLDRDGSVALAFIDVDYRKRFEPASLLSALKALRNRRAT